ncbi:MAG: hypothetical protein WCT39_04235, partial [Candidatus Margulisiibacteriota bacterium]
ISTINLTSEVSGFDWSPDENKLVYGITNSGTSEIYIISRDGMNNNFFTAGTNPAWKIGEYIAFEYSTPEGATLSAIKNDGTALNRLRIGFEPQFIELNRILYGYGIQIRLINLDGTQDELLFDNFDKRSNPKISSDKSKIVAMGIGYGIYVRNITGTGEVQIR